MIAGLAPEHGEKKTIMIDAAYLKAHGTTPWPKIAMVALARRIAVILHRIWVDGIVFEADAAPQRADRLFR